MPGPILHLGALVTCTHGGPATPVAPQPRVRVSGQPVVTIASPYTVTGCTLPPNAGGPCTAGKWAVGAARVKVMLQPVAVQVDDSTCVPTGTPLIPTLVQVRVRAT
jgi:hypothetical protein